MKHELQKFTFLAEGGLQIWGPESIDIQRFDLLTMTAIRPGVTSLHSVAVQRDRPDQFSFPLVRES